MLPGMKKRATSAPASRIAACILVSRSARSVARSTDDVSSGAFGMPRSLGAGAPARPPGAGPRGPPATMPDMPARKKGSGPAFTVEFPVPLEARRDGDAWWAEVDGRELRLSNLNKVFWPDEGYTKGDLLAY